MKILADSMITACKVAIEYGEQENKNMQFHVALWMNDRLNRMEKIVFMFDEFGRAYLDINNVEEK